MKMNITEIKKYFEEQREANTDWWNNLTRFEEGVYREQFEKREKELKIIFKLITIAEKVDELSVLNLT